MTPIATDNAPAAIGAYSQAITHAGVVYCLARSDSHPRALGGTDAHRRAALRNLDAILNAAGSSRDRVIRATIFGLYGRLQRRERGLCRLFGDTGPPERAWSSRLPKDALVEINPISHRAD